MLRLIAWQFSSFPLHFQTLCFFHFLSDLKNFGCINWSSLQNFFELHLQQVNLQKSLSSKPQNAIYMTSWQIWAILCLWMQQGYNISLSSEGNKFMLLRHYVFSHLGYPSDLSPMLMPRDKNQFQHLVVCWQHWVSPVSNARVEPSMEWSLLSHLCT